MPKRSAPPKPVVATPAPTLPEPIAAPTQILPGITAVNSEALNQQLDDLAELLRNALLMPRAEGSLRDALARVAILRKTLGL